MEILLPNGDEHVLNENVTLQEKQQVVIELASEWEDYCHTHWEHPSVRFFLDGLANYLVWHKEEREKNKRGKEDKYVLSKKKVEKLTVFKKDSPTINFTDLPKKEKRLLLGEYECE